MAVLRQNAADAVNEWMPGHGQRSRGIEALLGGHHEGERFGVGAWLFGMLHDDVITAVLPFDPHPT